jgi:hypothetical protein
MNRSALNSVPLGSGNSLPWITATVNQAIRLLCTTTISLTKRGVANQTMRLSAVGHSIRTVYGDASRTLSLVGTAAASLWIRTYATGYGYLRLVGAARALRQTHTDGATSLALQGTAYPRQLTAVHAAQTTGTLAVRWIAEGQDLYTGPAPTERTATAVEIKKQTTSPVSIGG